MIKVKTCTNQRINATSLSLLSTLYSVHICKITSSSFSPFTHFSHILCQSELDVLFDFQQVVLFYLFFFINGNYPCSCLLLQMKYRMYHNQRNIPDTFVRNSKHSSTWCTGKSLFVFKKKKNSLHENVTNCILILHLLLIPLLILCILNCTKLYHKNVFEYTLKVSPNTRINLFFWLFHPLPLSLVLLPPGQL